MGKTAFLFPGQGAQSVGMCRELHDSLPQAKLLFERAAEVLGYDLASICFAGTTEKLNATAVCQPALYVCGMAALESLRQSDAALCESVAGTAGLSLGEYTAIAFAGGISFEEGLILVQQRGAAMQAAADVTPSGMVSVLALDREQVEAVCDQARKSGEILQTANFLCPGNIAVSGHIKSCENVGPVAKAAGGNSIPLAVAGAFHTELMRTAVDKLAGALEQVTIQKTRIPVYSNVDGQPHSDPADLRKLLCEQVCSPVRWHDSIQKMLADGFDKFYEVGPGRVLRGLMKRIDRKIECVGTLD